jgi:hypothetical protein
MASAKYHAGDDDGNGKGGVKGRDKEIMNQEPAIENLLGDSRGQADENLPGALGGGQRQQKAKPEEGFFHFFLGRCAAPRLQS